jgi:hypothetical protein
MFYEGLYLGQKTGGNTARTLYKLTTFPFCELSNVVLSPHTYRKPWHNGVQLYSFSPV